MRLNLVSGKALTHQLRLGPILKQLIAIYGERLVRLKEAWWFDPEFDHPLLVQGSTGLLHLPAHLRARESDDFISRLVFITTGEFSGLADEILNGLGLDNKIELIG